MSRPASTVPGLFRCFLAITLVDVLAHAFGMRRMLRIAARAAKRRRPRSGLPAESIQLCARRVATAAAFYPRRALCLEQSVALYILLRRAGVPAEFRLGVQPLPFYAHSWVEVDGAPIDESPELKQTFATFANLMG